MRFAAWIGLAALTTATALQFPSAATAQPAAEARSAAGYVAKAGASDLFEIQSSQAALKKAQGADVKEFARMMIEHHTATSKDLTAAAKSAGLGAPPTTLPADKAKKVAALQSAPAAGFDAAYMREQVAGHEEALALHQAYAANGDNAALKQTAAKAVPIVQTHLQRARSLTATPSR